MGGYASTPRRAKTSEEETDGRLTYAASGMQGWRAAMEDAHIALLKVPQGTPPSAAEIGAARIGSTSRTSYSSLSMNQSPLCDVSGSNLAAALLGVIPSDGDGRGNGGGNRARAFTYPAGDPLDASLSPLGAPEGVSTLETSHAGDSAKEDTSNKVEGGPEDTPGRDSRAVSEQGSRGSSVTSNGGAGTGWKAVDLLEDASLFGVFDGHGGRSVADFCRDRLPGLLAASPEIRAGNWRTGFPQVYHALDKLLASGEGQEKSGGWGGSSRVDGVGVGCTIVTVLLDNKRRQCYVAHAGDSRCVLSRGGRAVQLTRDHKPRLSAEYARIVAAGGHVSRVGRVNDNLNLSRAIGDMAYKRNRFREPKDQIISAEPDVCRFLVTPGVDEFLLLACDGVWELMNTSEVVAFVRAGLRAGASPREVCENLLDACLSPDPRGTRYAGCDNMTVVLVLLEGWESALAQRARPRASTYSGEGEGGPSEAVAAISASSRRSSRRDSEPHGSVPERLPGNGEEEMAVPESNLEGWHRAATVAQASRGVPGSPGVPALTTSSEMPQRMHRDRQNSLPDLPMLAVPSSTAQAHYLSNGTRSLPRRRSDADSVVLLLRRLRAEGASGWPPRRLTTGGKTRPHNADGIDFSLASFSAPPIPDGRIAMYPPPILRRSSASSSAIAVATPGGVPPRQVGSLADVSQSMSRRRVAHLRSATAPMLPSPLLHHHRRPPSDERPEGAAATQQGNEIYASEADAAGQPLDGDGVVRRGAQHAHDLDHAQVAERPSTQDDTPVSPAKTGAAKDGAKEGAPTAAALTGRPDDAGVSLVFVPAPEGLSTVDVTVAASPRDLR